MVYNKKSFYTNISCDEKKLTPASAKYAEYLEHSNFWPEKTTATFIPFPVLPHSHCCQLKLFPVQIVFTR